mgnify:FL=1
MNSLAKWALFIVGGIIYIVLEEKMDSLIKWLYLLSGITIFVFLAKGKAINKISITISALGALLITAVIAVPPIIYLDKLETQSTLVMPNWLVVPAASLIVGVFMTIWYYLNDYIARKFKKSGDSGKGNLAAK